MGGGYVGRGDNDCICIACPHEQMLTSPAGVVSQESGSNGSTRSLLFVKQVVSYLLELIGTVTRFLGGSYPINSSID